MGDSTILHDHSRDAACDFYDCDPSALADPELEALLEEAVRAEFTVIGTPQFHRFGEGGAISALYLLSESHVAIHGSPEKGHCIEVTIHTCCILGLPEERDRSHDDRARALKQRFAEILKPALTDEYPDRLRATRDSKIHGKRFKPNSGRVLSFREARPRKAAKG